MSLPVHQLLNEVSRLTELQGVRVAIKESFKGAGIVGASALIGSLLLGPVGLAIGGTIGGCSAAYVAKKFKPIPYIILYELTLEQQKELAAAILRVVSSIPIRSATEFALNIAQDSSVATTVAMAVISYVNSQSGMEIID